ncbi:MAG TPA: hypothetical protein VL574_05485 [Stellaceae bacterium]|jgi:hypothetical protein|nr:hypothetical protein [Stellaceae bacterium]
MTNTEQEDPIVPTGIEHKIDEILDERGDLDQRYNYIDYHFVQDGMTALARAYCDSMRRASLYGPYKDQERATGAVAEAFQTAIMGYLQRRFDTIQVLGRDGYETVWQA